MVNVRHGARHWAASYAAMLRFDLAAQRNWLPMFALMQVLFGAGMAIIYGFYIGHLPAGAALFIVSGSPALAVLTAGLIGVTMMVTERQQAGSWDFIWSLPAPGRPRLPRASPSSRCSRCPGSWPPWPWPPGGTG